ncbi:MAG: HisA/HisF-related TIM barrel protein, partial [Patescibacteria group bacterium]
MIIPSIDLMNGKAVQLRQGTEKILEVENPVQLAIEFRKYGEIAVIDLDAAMGTGSNLELVKKICSIAECRVGGGIRSVEKAKEILRAGARKIIIGTKATPIFLTQLPKERLIVAVDTKNGKVLAEGWKKETEKIPAQLIKELENYCSEFLFTNVEKEGMLKGVDFTEIEKLKGITKNRITVAGGISSIGEIKKIEGLGFDSQIGMAVYAEKVNLAEAFIGVLDFNKNNGLVPTIVQDEKNQALMLSFSSRESLKQSFETGKAVYYSRSRKEIWQKGETSGNFQELLKARYDCDRDALLFTVRQKNFACHFGGYSCFSGKNFSLQEIFDGIADKVENPVE